MRRVFQLGRLIYGGYFVYNGVNHFLNREGLTAYARAKGAMPPAELAVPGSGALILLGGVSVAFGVRPEIGSLMILAFLAGVTPQMHDFWRAEDPGQRMNDLVNFTKNLGLVGGALMAAAGRAPATAGLHIRGPVSEEDRIVEEGRIDAPRLTHA